MKEHIILFGAGRYAKKIIQLVNLYFVIDAVCDNNTTIQGQLFQDRYKIISQTELKKKYSQDRVLIAIDNKKTYNLILEQLVGLRIVHVNKALLEAMENEKVDFYIEEENVLLIKKFKVSKRKIFVLGAPSHSNMGDQAQSYCIEEILKNRYPEDNIYLFDEKKIIKNYYELLFIIKQQLKKDDLILLHSGYRLTNLYMASEYIVEMMGDIFRDRKMIFLPQTIHYTDDKIKSRIGRIINQNVVIMCRDVQSLENAKEIFPKAKSIAYPDIVTSLIGKYKFYNNRKGILLVMRNVSDGESIETEDDIYNLKEQLKKIARVTQTDTTLDVDWTNIANNKKKYVLAEIEKYSCYQLIITNRYHGTVFALAANTPVIILPTKDHKVVGGLKWFEEARYQNCFVCKSFDEIINKAEYIVEKNKISYNSDYLYQNYYRDFCVEELTEQKEKKEEM